MEMRYITSNGKSRQIVASRSTIAHICRNNADNLNAISFRGVDYWPSTNAVNCNTINEVFMTILTSSADVSGEKAQSVGSDAGIAQPTNLSTNFQGSSSWEEWYRLIWKLKVARRDKNYG